MLWHKLRYTYVDENGVRTHGVHTGQEDVREYIALLYKHHRDLTYLYIEQTDEWEVPDYEGVAL